MISQNVVYHRACLVAFYNRAKAKNIDKDKNQGQQRIEDIALAELIAYMKIHISKVTQLPYLD